MLDLFLERNVSQTVSCHLYSSLDSHSACEGHSQTKDCCLSIDKCLAPANVFPSGINAKIATFARVVFPDQLSALMSLCPIQNNWDAHHVEGMVCEWKCSPCTCQFRCVAHLICKKLPKSFHHMSSAVSLQCVGSALSEEGLF